MSASNWAICPRCLGTAKTAHDDALQHALLLYGTVPLNEFEEARAAADVNVDEEAFRTFREDYEIYGASKGTITVSYSGHCGTCSLNLDFEYSEAFYDDGAQAVVSETGPARSGGGGRQ